MTPKESAAPSRFLWSADLLPNRCRPSLVNHEQMEILFYENECFFFQRDLNCKRSCCNLQPNTVRGSRWTSNQRSLLGDRRRCHSRWAGTTRVGTPGRRVQLCGTIIALLSLMSPPSIRPSVLPFYPLTKMHSPSNYHPSWTPPSCQNNHRCGLNQTKGKVEKEPKSASHESPGLSFCVAASGSCYSDKARIYTFF